MTEELTKQVCCIKYSLMACNAFGIMLGIMAVLFGTAYPEENFPGGYKGKETAGISAFFIVFTLIGYYGAHRQRIYFLIPYSIIIFLFLGGNLMMWSIKPEESVLDPDSEAIKIIGSVFALVMVCALWLAWQERKKNLQLYGTTNIPSSMSNYFSNPNPYLSNQSSFQPPQYQSTAQFSQPPPMYQNQFAQQPQSFQMREPWNLESKGNPVNLVYQPGSNTYLTLQPSLGQQSQYQREQQQQSQYQREQQQQSQYQREQQQQSQYQREQQQQSFDRGQQQQSFDRGQQQQGMQREQQRMNGSIGQPGQSSSSGGGGVGPLIMY